MEYKYILPLLVTEPLITQTVD